MNNVGYNSVAIFIHLVVVASQICEIPRNSTKIRTSGSSNVIDLVNPKAHICDFLLVINSNYGSISYLFEILTHLAVK